MSKMILRNFGVTFISPSNVLIQSAASSEFRGRTPFNVLRLVVVIVGAVAASDLRASELDGLVMMRHAVKEQQN